MIFEALNIRILSDVCEGVYRVGLARTQEAHDAAAARLFETLDWLDSRLSTRPFLLGNRITESDWQLFATLVRFDAAYHGALKCNLRRLVDYGNLSAYTRRLYHQPGVAETARLDQIKLHYYDVIGEIEPRIVPAGPARDFLSAA